MSRERKIWLVSQPVSEGEYCAKKLLKFYWGIFKKNIDLWCVCLYMEIRLLYCFRRAWWWIIVVSYMRWYEVMQWGDFLRLHPEPVRHGHIWISISFCIHDCFLKMGPKIYIEHAYVAGGYVPQLVFHIKKDWERLDVCSLFFLPLGQDHFFCPSLHFLLCPLFSYALPASLFKNGKPVGGMNGSVYMSKIYIRWMLF